MITAEGVGVPWASPGLACAQSEEEAFAVGE